MLLSLPLFLLTFQVGGVPEPNRVVVFKESAARLVNLEKPLSDVLGVPVIAGPTVKDDVVAIWAESTTRQALALKIAQCLDAEWIQEGPRLVLHRTQQSLERARKRSTDYRAERIKENLAKVRAELEAQGAFTEAYATGLAASVKDLDEQGGLMDSRRSDSIRQRSPLGRFGLRLLRSISAEELARIPPEGRAVFRPRPNRRQRKLPSVKPLIATLQQESEIYNRALAPLTIMPHRQPWDSVPEFARTLSLGEDVDVALTIHASEYGLSALTSLFDASGAVLGSDYRELNWFEEIKQPSGSTKLEHGPIATDIIAAYRAVRQKTTHALSPATREFLLHPEIHEPLSLDLDPAIRAWADSTGMNIIIRPHDALCLTTMGILMGSQSTLEWFQTRLSNAETIVRDGWVLVRPWLADLQSAKVTNRVALGEWLRSVNSQGPTMGQTLKFEANSGARTSAIFQTWFRLLFPERSDREIYRYQGIAPVIMGRLTPTQVERLCAGQSLRWLDLAPEVRRDLEATVFTNASALQVMEHENRHKQGWHAREPTEVFPMDLPSDAKVTLKRSVSYRYASVSSTTPSALGRLPRNSCHLGFHLARRDEGKVTPIQGWPETFYQVPTEEWNLRVEFSPLLYLDLTYVHLYSPPSQEFNLDALPSELKDAVNKWAEYYRRHPEQGAPPAFYEDLGPPPTLQSTAP